MPAVKLEAGRKLVLEFHQRSGLQLGCGTWLRQPCMNLVVPCIEGGYAEGVGGEEPTGAIQHLVAAHIVQHQ